MRLVFAALELGMALQLGDLRSRSLRVLLCRAHQRHA